MILPVVAAEAVRIQHLPEALPEAVVEKVRHAFTSDKPKLRYPVTLVTHAVALLKRLLPARAMDKIIHG